MGLRFTWDPHKAVANFRKHGVSFYEAVTAFADPFSITVPASGSSAPASPVAVSDTPMKKKTDRVREVATIRSEYDFKGGVRGKYAKSYAQSTNVVLLEPDVAIAFPTSRAVNVALRKLLRDTPARPRRAARKRST